MRISKCSKVSCNDQSGARDPTPPVEHTIFSEHLLDAAIFPIVESPPFGAYSQQLLVGRQNARDTSGQNAQIVFEVCPSLSTTTEGLKEMPTNKLP